MPKKSISRVKKNGASSGDQLTLIDTVEAGASSEADAPPPLERRSAVDILVTHLKKDGERPQPGGDGWQEVFLEALARAPVASVAARIAGVRRSQAAALRKSDPEFARRWDEAVEEGLDEVEAAAFHGAVYGDERPVYYGGARVGTTIEHSQAMRTLLLKHRRRALYGEKPEPQESGVRTMTLAELKQRVAEARGEL